MPKYQVEVTDVITRSTFIVVEADSPEQARNDLEHLFNRGDVESDAILERLSIGFDDTETTFTNPTLVDPSTPVTLLVP